MPLINIDRTYADGDILFEADLDNIKTACETLLNTTLLDSENFQSNSIAEANINSGIFTTSDKISTYTIPVTKINNSAIANAKIASNTLPMRTTSSYSGTENTSSGQNSAVSSLATTASTSTRGVLMTPVGSTSYGWLASSTSSVTYPLSITSTLTYKKGATTVGSVDIGATIYFGTFSSGTVVYYIPISSVKHPFGQAPAATATLQSTYAGIAGKVNETELR
jgi:hypothetical protein